MPKYDALADWLFAQHGMRALTTFDDLDAVVSRLPPSARTDRTWWGNTTNRTRVQAKAWLSSGWKVESVDLITGQVAFVRTEPGRTRG